MAVIFADLGKGDAWPPPGQNLFISMQFLGKKLVKFSGGFRGAPPYGPKFSLIS